MRCLLIFFLLVVIQIKLSYLKQEKKYLHDDDTRETLINKENGKEEITPVVSTSLRYQRTIKKANSSKGTKKECTCPENQKVHSVKAKAGDPKKKCECLNSSHFDSSTAHSSSHSANNYLQDTSGEQLREQSGNGRIHGFQHVFDNPGRRSNCGFNVYDRKNEFQLGVPIANTNHPNVQGSNYNDALCPEEDDHGFLGAGVIKNLNSAYQKNFGRNSQFGYNENYMGYNDPATMMGYNDPALLGLGARLTNRMDSWQSPDRFDYKQIYGFSNPTVSYQNDLDSLKLINMGLELDNKLLINDILQQNNQHNSQTIHSKSIEIHEKPFRRNFITQDLSATIENGATKGATIENEYESHPTNVNSDHQCKDCEYNEPNKQRASEQSYKSFDKEDENVFNEIFSNFIKRFGNQGFSFNRFLQYLQKKASQENHKKSHERAMANYLLTVKKYFEDHKKNKKYEKNDESSEESANQYSNLDNELESQSSIQSNNIDSEDFKEKYGSSNSRKDYQDPFYYGSYGNYVDDVSFQKAIQSLPLREVSFFPKKFFHDKRFHSGGIDMLLKMFYSSSNAPTKGCQKKNCAEDNDSSLDGETNLPNTIKTKNSINDDDVEIAIENDKHRQEKPKSINRKEFQSEPLRDQDHWNHDSGNIEHHSYFNSYSQDERSQDENNRNSFINDEVIPKIENNESDFEKKKTSAAFDSEEREFFPCPFQSEKNKVMICYHTKNGIKYLNTVRLEDRALENLEKLNKNSESKILNKVHDLMKFDEEHFVSQIGSIFPSSKKIKERDNLLRKLELEKWKDRELMKSRIFSAEQKAIENLAKKIGHGDRRQGAAILSQMLDESDYIQDNGQPASDVRKGNVIEIKSDHDSADGILKVTEPDSSESPSYILNKIRNNNATKRNTGPVRLLPSHNGGLIYGTPDLRMNNRDYDSVDAIKKSLFFKPGRTLQTPYGSLKLVPVDELFSSSPSNIGESTFSNPLSKNQPMALKTAPNQPIKLNATANQPMALSVAANNSPIKIQLALDPLTLKALTDRSSVDREINNNINNDNSKDIETVKTIETMALGALLSQAAVHVVPFSIPAQSEPPENDAEKNLAFKPPFENPQAIHTDAQLVTAQKTLNKAASDAVNVAIELISALDTFGANNDGATQDIGGILKVGEGNGAASFENTFDGLVANSTSINQNNVPGKLLPESLSIQNNGKTENLKRIRRDVDKASHGLQRDVFYFESSSKSNIEALTSSRKYPGNPDVHENIEEFDAPVNIGDKYGQRVYGWFLPPQSGKYIFYTSCDDACELYISNNDDPKNKKMIIAQDDWSKHNEWDKYPAQQTSKTIDLQKEQGYYIEAIMSDSSGEDHLSVGVRLPDGNLFRPIPNHLLSPVRIVNFPLSFVTINKAVITPDHLVKNMSNLFAASIKSNESVKRDKTHIVPRNKSYQSTLNGVLENLTPPEMANSNTRVQIPRNIFNAIKHKQNNESPSLYESYIRVNNESKGSRSQITEENKFSNDLYLNPTSNYVTYNNVAKTNNFINSDKKNKIVNIAAVDDKAVNIAAVDDKPEFIPVPISQEFQRSKFDEPKNLQDDLFFSPTNADFKKIKDVYGGNLDYEDSFQYDDTDHHVGIINTDEESKTQNSRSIENIASENDNGESFNSGQDKSLVINDNQAIEMKNKYSNRGKVVLDFSKGNEYAKIIIYDLRKKPVERKSLVNHPASKNLKNKNRGVNSKPDKSKNRGEKKDFQNKGGLLKTQKKAINSNFFESHGQGINRFESSAQSKAGVKRSQGNEKNNLLSYPGINLWIFEKVYRDKLLKGTPIDSLYNSDRYPDQPDKELSLSLMDTGKKTGNNVGQMIWGWLKVPIDGEYTFFSSCGDECDVYMSPDNSKDHIRKIISQRKFSKSNQWDKYPEEQTSPLIRLSSGKAYYIQAVCALLTGNSGCSVGMQLPNGKMSRPINEEYLSREINSKQSQHVEYDDATDQHEIQDFMKTQSSDEQNSTNANSELVTNLLQLSKLLMGKTFADELVEKHLHKHLGISKNAISTTLHILLRKIKNIREKAFMREDEKNRVRRNSRQENLSDIYKKDDIRIFSSNENRSQSHSNTVLFGDRSLFQIPQHVTHISQEQRYANHNINELKLDLSPETEAQGIEDLKLIKEGTYSTNKTINELKNDERNIQKQEPNITDHLIIKQTTDHLTESLFNNNLESANKIFNSSAALLIKNKTTDISFIARVNDSVPDSQQSNNDAKTHHLDIPTSSETANIGKISKESLQLESVVLYRKKRDLDTEMIQTASKKHLGGEINKRNKRGYKTLKNLQFESPDAIVNQFHDFASALPSHLRSFDPGFQYPLLFLQQKNARSFVSHKKGPVLSKLKKLQNFIKMDSSTSIVGKRKNSIPFSRSVVGDISTAIEVQNPVKNNFVSRAELPEIIGTDGTGSMERIDISHMRAAQPESFSPLPPIIGPTLNGLPLLRSSQIGTKTTVFDLNLSGGSKSSILQVPSSSTSINQSPKIFKHDDKTEESISVTNFSPVSDDSLSIPIVNNNPIVTAATKNKEQELGIDVAPSKSELSRESAINSNPLTKDLHKNIFKEEDIKWSSDPSLNKIKPSAVVINNSKVRSLLSDARKSTNSRASKFDWLFNENINEGKRKEEKENSKFKEKQDDEDLKLDKENSKQDDETLKQDEENSKSDEENLKQDEESSKLDEENLKPDYDNNEYEEKENENKVKSKDPQISDILHKERDVDKMLHEEMRHYGKNSRKIEDDKWNEEEELTQVPNSKIYDYENEPDFSNAEKDYKDIPVDDFHPPVNNYDDREFKNQRSPEFRNGDNGNHHLHYHHPEKNSRDDDERNLNYRDDLNLDEELPHELNENDEFHLRARSDDGFGYKPFNRNHELKSNERFQENHDKDYQDNKRDEPLDLDHLKSFKHFLKDIANDGDKREKLFFHLKKKHTHDMTRRNQVRRTINGLVHIYNSLINEKNIEHKNHVHKYKSPLKFEKARKRSKSYDRQFNFLKKAYSILQKGSLLHSSNLKAASDSFYPTKVFPNHWHQLKEPILDDEYIINKYLTNSEDSRRLEHMLKKQVYDDLEITNLVNNKSKKPKKLKVEKYSNKNLDSLEMALKQLSAAAEKNSSKEYEDLIHRLSPYLGKLKEIDSKLNKSQVNDPNTTFNLQSNGKEKENLNKELGNTLNSTESEKDNKDEDDLELNKITDVGSNLQETKEDLISALENAQAVSQKHINNVESHLDVASYRPLLPIGITMGKIKEKTTNQMLPGNNIPFNTNAGVITSNSLSNQYSFNKTIDSFSIQLGDVDGLAPQPIPVIEDKSASPEKIIIRFNKSMEETIPISNSIFKIKPPLSLQLPSLQFSKPNYFNLNGNFHNKNCEPVADGVDIPFVPPCHNLNTFGAINTANNPAMYPVINPGLYTEKIRMQPINHIVNLFKAHPVTNLNSNRYPSNMKVVGSSVMVDNRVPVNFLNSFEEEPHFKPQPLSLDRILQSEASETPSVVLPWQNSFQDSKFRNFYPLGPRISHGFNNGGANNLILNTPMSRVTNGDGLYNGFIPGNTNLFQGIEHSPLYKNNNDNAIYNGLDSYRMDQDTDRKNDIVKSGGLLKQGKYSVIKKLPVIFKFFDDSNLEGENAKDFDSGIERKNSHEKLVLENESESNDLGVKLNEKKRNIQNSKKKLPTTILTQPSNRSVNSGATVETEEEMYSGERGESGESGSGYYKKSNSLKEKKNDNERDIRANNKKYKNKVNKELIQNSNNNIKRSMQGHEFYLDKKKNYTTKFSNISKMRQTEYQPLVNITLHELTQHSKKYIKPKHAVQKSIRPPQSPYSNKNQLVQVFSFVPYTLQTRMYNSCYRPPVANQKCVNGKCDLYNRGLHSFGLLHSPELINSFCHSGQCKHCPDHHSGVPFHHHCDEDHNDDSDHCGEHHNHEEHGHCCNHGHHHNEAAHEHECCHHGNSCYKEHEHGHNFGGEHCMAHPSEAHPIYYCGPNMDPQHIGQRGHHGESGLGGEGPYHGETYHERDCEHKCPLPVPVIIKPPPPCHGQNPYEILTTSQMHNGYQPNGYFDDTAIIQMQNPHSTFGEHEHGGPIYAVPIKNQLTYPDEGSDRNYEKRCIPGSKCKGKELFVDKASIFDLISKVNHRSASQQNQSSEVKEEKKKHQQKLKTSYAMLNKLKKMTAALKHKHSKKINKGFFEDSNVVKFELPQEGSPSDDDDHQNDENSESEIKNNSSPHMLNAKEGFSFSSNSALLSKNETNLLPKNESFERIQREMGYMDLNTSTSDNASAIELFKSMALDKNSENFTTEHFYYLESGNQTISVPSMSYNETIPASDLFKALYSEKKLDPVTDLLKFSVSGATINKDEAFKQKTERAGIKNNNTVHNEKDDWVFKKKSLANKTREKVVSKKNGKHDQKIKVKSNFQSNTTYNNEISENSRKKRAVLDSLTENNSDGKQNKGQLLSIEQNILKLVLNMTNLLLSQDKIEKMVSEEKLVSAGNINSPSEFHDFVLLVDVSSAVDELEFTLIQQYIGDLVSKVMNDSKVSVGIVSFGQFQQMDVPLSNDPHKVQFGISTMKYMGDTGNLTSALKFVDENVYQAEQEKRSVQQLCIILGGIPYYSQNAVEFSEKLKSQGVEIFAVGIGKMFKADTLLLEIASIPILGHTLYTDYENLLLSASNNLYSKIKKGWYAYIAKKKKKNEKITELSSTNKNLNKTAVQQRCEACRKRILSGLGQSTVNKLIASKICFACYENQDVGSFKIVADPLQFTSRAQDVESSVLYQNPVITAINEGNISPGHGIGLAYSPIINAPFQPLGPDRSIAKVVYDGPNSNHQKLEVLDSEELLHYQQHHHEEESHPDQVFESQKYDPYLADSHLGSNYDSSHVHYATEVTNAHSPSAVTSHLTSTEKLIQTPLTTSHYQSVTLSRPLPIAPIVTPLVEKVEQNPYEVLVSEQLKPKYKPILHVDQNQVYKNDNRYELHRNEAEDAQIGNQGNVFVSLDQSVQPVLQQEFDLEGPDSLSYMQKLQDLSSESEMMYPLKKRRLKVKSALRIPTLQNIVANGHKIPNLEKKSETRSNKVGKNFNRHNVKLKMQNSTADMIKTDA